MRAGEKPIERLLLTRVCDLDNALREPDLRELVERFLPSYLLVALPKSAGTYCTHALSRILEAQTYKDIVTQDVFTPKDLSISGIVNARNRATISQVHLTATGANLRIIRNFGIPFVILLRNLFDVVVSMRDHMNKNSFFSSILIPNNFASLSEREKLDYIIDTAVPWMITLYASWVQAAQRGDVETEYFRYEDMLGDPVAFFCKICTHLGRPLAKVDVRNKLFGVEKSVETRFNIGIVGRGEVELNKDQKQRIRRFATYYPGTDFSPLGL